MALAPSQVRRRVAESLSSELGSYHHESPHSFDQFPGLDGDAMADGAFAVGLGRTVTTPEDRRQRRSRALVVVTEVLVRMSATVRYEDQPADYDRGADMEHRVLQAVMATNKDPDLEVVFREVRTRRVVLGGRLYLAELRFDVRHGLELA